MKKLALVLMVFGLLAGPGVMSAHAREGSTYIVRPGDTLMRIAARHGVSVSQLARANGLQWNAWVYAGQRLTIPGRTGGSTHPSQAGAYVVRYGDTLTRIAARHGISVSELASANGLHGYSWVYAGQQLTIPGSTPPSVSQPASGVRWIDVNLTTQMLTAYEGSRPVYAAAVSTGLPWTPTPKGQFRIWVKLMHSDAGAGVLPTQCALCDVLPRRVRPARYVLASEFRHADEPRMRQSLHQRCQVALQLGVRRNKRRSPRLTHGATVSIQRPNPTPNPTMGG